MTNMIFYRFAGSQKAKLLLLFFMLKLELVGAHNLTIAKVMRKSDFDFLR